MTQTAAQLTRELYKIFLESGNFHNKISGELYSQLLVMCKTKIYDVDICENNVQQAIMNIYDSITKNNATSIWQTTLELTEENDKRLTGYLYKVLLTSNRENDKDFWKKETQNLKRAIKGCISELVHEEKLIVEDGYCYLANSHPPAKGYTFNFPNVFFSIRSKNGELDWQRVKELILIIFVDYMENHSLSISNVLEIIAKVADVGNQSLISKDETCDDDEDSFRIEIKDTKASSDTLAISDDFILLWIERANKVFTKEELEIRIKLFLMYYKEGMTLGKIEAAIDFNIKKSSIDNYIKQFIKSLEIMNEVDNNDPNMNYYMNSLLFYLSDRYNTIIDAEK